MLAPVHPAAINVGRRSPALQQMVCMPPPEPKPFFPAPQLLDGRKP